ncbi:MAG: hypothetical protein ACFCUW_07585 [Kiloniellaceae bacterium]
MTLAQSSLAQSLKRVISISPVAAAAVALLLAFAPADASAAAREKTQATPHASAQLHLAHQSRNHGWNDRKHRRHAAPPHRRHGFVPPPHRRHFHAGPRRHFHAAPRRHASCRPITAVGYHRGHRALIARTVCVNRFGQAYVLQGSQRVVRYLHR